MTSLSVIIPAYNSDSKIRRTLDAVCQSSRAPDELLVIDDGSTDSTHRIAQEYPARILRHPERRGRHVARNQGILEATGDILVYIDSDVIIQPDTLKRIHDYFTDNPTVSAITGITATRCPDSSFFSVYKNLYMHYRFKMLPKQVTFLYGSLYAIRKEVRHLCFSTQEIAEDTTIGQSLHAEGKVIHLVKNLEVIHNKSYSFWSFVKNDFLIPYWWAHVFVTFKGWKQIVRKGAGFAHASLSQLIGISAALLILLSLCCALMVSPQKIAMNAVFSVSIASSLVWCLMHMDFFRFVRQKQGVRFGLLAIPATYIDNVTMVFGILIGLCIATTKQTLSGLAYDR